VLRILCVESFLSTEEILSRGEIFAPHQETANLYSRGLGAAKSRMAAMAIFAGEKIHLNVLPSRRFGDESAETRSPDIPENCCGFPGYGRTRHCRHAAARGHAKAATKTG
jgi:hypothetical protein